MNATRRGFLLGCLCGCGFPHTGATGQSIASTTEGQCFFDSAASQKAAGDVKNGLYRETSGDAGRDRTISGMLFQSVRTYGLNRAELPTFRFIPATVAGDGFATGDVIGPGTKGLVALNLKLLNGSDTMGLLGFQIIMAHEFAHIFQMRNQYIDRFRAAGAQTREIELHADYLAGWYMSQQGEISTGLLEIVANTLFSRGDNNVDVREHHGTKVDRMSAVLKGYLSGTSTDVASAAALNGILYLQDR
ncbi:hypothetical protein [Rhizobium leguminosarum]|uniref:hypothetical protein n=1 Tax=Rhizobium leguminosarum TaxID=384 RepID=UPI001C959085|nr:hypothetical protein [Rhizobium leguminosarum]MBY5794989.1 hypothetical protein [Rhizobium leguminosarum]